jgi:DNA-directed RNA polymerase subunit N (RpoN/RPB10)
MIIPMVCFTCGCPIAQHWIEYTKLVKEYELEDSVKPKNDPDAKSPEYKALAKLGIARDCCRRMFLSEHPMYTQVR